jgi:hypothetical protein
MSAARLIAGAWLSLVGLAALAADASIGGVALALPAPAGYHDAATIAPSLVKFGESLAPSANRVLGFYVHAEDRQRILGGLGPQLKRYHLAQTDRSREQTPVSAAQFNELRGLIRAEMKNLADEKTAAQPAAGIGKTSPLGIFIDRDDAIAFLASVNYPREVNGRQENLPVAVATAITLVKGRQVSLYSYFIRQDDADIAQAKEASRAWLAAVQKANRAPRK